MKKAEYVSAINRYASPEMKGTFSQERKFEEKGWRGVWYALAKVQSEMGLPEGNPITQEQLAELKSKMSTIDYERAKEIEGEIRHDVMAHARTYGEQCPSADPIIHLGATSAFVTDHTELSQFREGMEILEYKLARNIGLLGKFAKENKDLPCLGYTHFQPGQPTTVGKRATLWAYDLVIGLEYLKAAKKFIKARGIKGTTGSNASYFSLLKGDREKLKQLNNNFIKEFGFEDTYAVTGQTYSRMIDSIILSPLGAIAGATHKFGNDIRLLQHLKEVEEPFGKKQVGSSAMAYKRNPMRTERICALARQVIKLTESGNMTHATQWFERTLDDSAGRRTYLPEAFLGLDAILGIQANVTDGLVVYPAMIEKHLMAELPFMATEEVLMRAVEKGGNRQEIHEIIRDLAQKAGDRVKQEGADNDLLERMGEHPDIPLDMEEINSLVDPSKFIGDAPGQVVDFVNEIVEPILKEYDVDLEEKVDDLKV